MTSRSPDAASYPDWLVRPDVARWRCGRPSGDARPFHASLPGYAPTPLINVPALAARWSVGAVVVKNEASRFGLPAFKALGASWAVARLLADRAGIDRADLHLD